MRGYKRAANCPFGTLLSDIASLLRGMPSGVDRSYFATDSGSGRKWDRLISRAVQSFKGEVSGRKAVGTGTPLSIEEVYPAIL